MYEIDVEFSMPEVTSTSNGFSIMLYKAQPSFPEQYEYLLGANGKYNGIGVFLYKQQRTDKWVSNQRF